MTINDRQPSFHTTDPAAVLLTAVSSQRSITPVLEAQGFAIVSVPNGRMAIDMIRDVRPDVILVEADLPDMSGLDVCRRMRDNPAVGRTVPIILLVAEQPTPAQRVNALRAGVWEFLQHGGGADEVLLKLRTCLEAKRNVDAARADGFTDWTRVLHDQNSFARRAQQLGALMARMHAPFACIVFELETDEPDPEAGECIAQAVRASDIVGEISPSRFGVLASATDAAGAVALAARVSRRFGHMIVDRATIRGVPPMHWSMRAGYDAVSNAMYSPVDPAPFIARASTAVRGGTPEPGSDWIRRFPVAAPDRPEPHARPWTPASLQLKEVPR